MDENNEKSNADKASSMRFKCLTLAATANGTEAKSGAEVVALAEQYAAFVMPSEKDTVEPVQEPAAA